MTLGDNLKEVILYLTSLPSVLKILGSDSEVILDSIALVAEGNVGSYQPETKAIHMLESYPDKELHDNTIIHEMIHAICRRIGIQLDHQTEEILAETISVTIAENFDLAPKGICQCGTPQEDQEDTTGEIPEETQD